MKIIAVSVNEDQWSIIKDYCKEQDIPVSNFMRKLALKYIEKQKEENLDGIGSE